ncbi:lecithin retinol acyltransferase-like [Bombina bombina]|uniref:lecithin retinol acyltransferase-like n=1 Tax=Bombina bombina TaxID=8345 RepID=UPI00235A8C27|nr:lecithin retinol acyltransferase-like [Bombina bombina]
MKTSVLDILSYVLDKILVFVNLKTNCRQIIDNKNTNIYELSLFKRGDLFEVPRTLFVHFGIYLGDNKVAHLMPDILPAFSSDKSRIQRVVTNTRLILGVLTKMASVRVDTVKDFAYGGIILINHMDHSVKNKPLPAEEVVQRAEKLVGATAYSLLWDNCEHFVTYCRYGIALSFQTDKLSPEGSRGSQRRRSSHRHRVEGSARIRVPVAAATQEKEHFEKEDCIVMDEQWQLSGIIMVTGEVQIAIAINSFKMSTAIYSTMFIKAETQI